MFGLVIVYSPGDFKGGRAKKGVGDSSGGEPVGDERDRHRQRGDDGQQAAEVLLEASDFVSGERHGVVCLYHAEAGRVCSYSHGGEGGSA